MLLYIFSTGSTYIRVTSLSQILIGITGQNYLQLFKNQVVKILPAISHMHFTFLANQIHN